MNKEKVMEYVMHTPGNTNPNVLDSLLDDDGGITPTGTINITENGEFDVSQYANANVNVSGGGTPTMGTVYITNNSGIEMSIIYGAISPSNFIYEYSTPLYLEQTLPITLPFLRLDNQNRVNGFMGVECGFLQSGKKIVLGGENANVQEAGNYRQNAIAYHVNAGINSEIVITVEDIT